MIPKHWIPKEQERFIFEEPSKIRNREEFYDSMDKKVYKNSIARRVQSYKILFEINLEERRNKLWNLLFNEEKEIQNELDNKFEQIETRRERLKENARIIRTQKELERQQLANEKLADQFRLSDPYIRELQYKLHNDEINKDREKLKEYKNQLKRENECENYFWLNIMKEENNKMLERELNETNKRNIISNDLLDQMKEREADKLKQKLNKQQENEFNYQQAKLLEENMKKEKIDNYNTDLMKKLNYRKSLDKQINHKNCIKSRDKQMENDYDNIMNDENAKKINKQTLDNNLKKVETKKHFINYMNYQKCLELKRKEELKLLEANVIKTQLENEKKRDRIDKERLKKYQALIKDIKDAQKDQLKVHFEKKRLENEEKLVERKEMEIKINADIEKEKQLKKERHDLLIAHNNDLIGQIEFNKHLNELNNIEKEREKKAMYDEENKYLNMLEEIRKKEILHDIHPWRTT